MKNDIHVLIKNSIYKYFVIIFLFFWCNALHGQNKDNVSVSLDNLNALYLGIDNSITIAIAGIPSENLKIKINTGSIEGKNGKYIAKIYKTGTAIIEIYDREKLIGTREFKCLFIPSPVPYLAGLTGDTNSKREDLISAECITAEIPNFLLDLKFTVTSFSMMISLIKQDQSISELIVLNSTSGCLTEEMKKYILNPNIESAIYFDNINVLCPDGINRKINSRITIRLTDEILNKLDLEKQKVIGQNAEILFKEKRISEQNAKMNTQSNVLEQQTTQILKRKNKIKDQENEILFQKNILKAQVIKIKNQKMFLGISIFVIVGIIFLMIFSIRSYLKVKETNLTLAEKNRIIARKNLEITDSINYAQRIQKSILPPLIEVAEALPKSFILFKPKDIVSGDFYWFHEKVMNDTEKETVEFFQSLPARPSSLIFIAAADCTGHGVPGAFMSAIGSEKLNEAVLRSEDVSEILKSVNIGMKKVLHQSGKEDSTSDGMDIALCAFNKDMTQLEFAGANRPIWVIRNGIAIIDETKATKAAIGGQTLDEQKFVKHTIDLQKNDTVYLFSDGFADQFGIKDNKKLKTRKFKEEILNNSHKSMEDQKIYFDHFIENWKGSMEQTDDILVIGIRI